MRLPETADCKAFLVNVYGGNLKDWKRKSKQSDGPHVHRTFSFKDGKEFILTTDLTDLFVAVEPLRPSVPYGLPGPDEKVMVIRVDEPVRNIQLGDHPPKYTPPPKTDSDLVEELRRRSAAITHCGDYCLLYYNKKRKALWIVLGDGDPVGELGGKEDPMTYIQQIYADLPEIEEVRIEAEYSPESLPGSKGRDEWIMLPGEFGTVVNDW